jgi:hypothetical protein
MSQATIYENANDLLYTIVASYHVLVDKLEIGRAPSSDWLRLLEDVATATLSDPRTRSPGRDPEQLSDRFWIEELDPRADRVVTSREPLAADLFFATLVVLTIDEYKKIVSNVDPSIDTLRTAAAKALADDFAIDLERRPSPEPEIAIACARDAAKAWVRWVNRT